MKNFKRIAAILMTLVLVLGCVGCSNSSDDSSNQSSTGTESSKKDDSSSKKSDTSTKTEDTSAGSTESGDADADDEEEEEFVIDRSKKAYIDQDGIYRYSANDEIVDLGGMEVIVGDWWSTDSEPETASEIARAEYIEEMEATYNFTISAQKVWNYGVYDEEYNNYATSGGDENYVLCVANGWITTPMRNGLMYDLSTLDCLDFTDEKWDISTSNKMHLGGGIYGMRAEASEPRGGVYFNYRLLEEAGVDPESLYDMQANHTWTWDAFEELCAKLTRDTDNDGIIDIYAMSSFNGDLMNSICASNGAQIIDYDENGNFINATNTEEFLTAYDWAHNLRQLYEAPQPEGTEWNYSYDMFINAEVCMIVSEEYRASSFNDSMADDFGFVVFPMGPDVDDYNGYSTDNAYVIPACYDEETAWNIAFAYNLYTNPTPGYDDDDDWKTPYYAVFRDERAVDETLEILRDHQEACIYPLVPDVNYNNNYWWNIDAETAAERYETMKDEIQALIDAVQ